MKTLTFKNRIAYLFETLNGLYEYFIMDLNDENVLTRGTMDLYAVREILHTI